MPEDRSLLRTVAEWIAGFDSKPETEDVDFAGALVKFVSEQRQGAIRECAEANCRRCKNGEPMISEGLHHNHQLCLSVGIRRAFPSSFKKKETHG